MTGLFQDLRFAILSLNRDRRFTLLAVLALALGIGSVTVIFSAVATGVIGVYGIGRLMRSTLDGVEGVDIRSFAAVAVVLVAAALLACYIPARRTAKVDPLVALRYE